MQVSAQYNLPNVELRSTSFSDEIKRKGLVIVKSIQSDSDSAVATSEMSEFLRKRVFFDAVFAENDNLALGVIKALKAHRRDRLEVMMSSSLILCILCCSRSAS